MGSSPRLLPVLSLGIATFLFLLCWFGSGQFVRKPAGRNCLVLPECHDLESLGQAKGASDGVHSPGDWISSAVDLLANQLWNKQMAISQWESSMPLFPNKAVVTRTDNLCSQSDH